MMSNQLGLNKVGLSVQDGLFGHIQCMERYTKSLAHSVKDKKTLVTMDGFLYIVGSIPMFVITLLLLVVNAGLYIGESMTRGDLIYSYMMYLIPTFIFPIIVGAVIMKLDGRPIRPMIKGLLCYPLFLGSWLAINFKCLFKRETSWEKIDHVRDIKINEVI